MSETKEKTFEENITRLEEIVSHLERGDVLLAESLALFDVGTMLVETCTGMLDKAEQKVVRLKRGPEEDLIEVPFDGEA